MIDDRKKLWMICDAIGLAGGPVQADQEHGDLYFLRVLNWIFDYAGQTANNPALVPRKIGQQTATCAYAPGLDRPNVTSSALENDL